MLSPLYPAMRVRFAGYSHSVSDAPCEAWTPPGGSQPLAQVDHYQWVFV